jgi:hypothetical protein
MDSVTINKCPHCRIFVQNKRIRWSCDDHHPEVLEAIEREHQMHYTPREGDWRIYMEQGTPTAFTNGREYIPWMWRDGDWERSGRLKDDYAVDSFTDTMEEVAHDQEYSYWRPTYERKV